MVKLDKDEARTVSATFRLRPTVKAMLEEMAKAEDRSGGYLLERMIVARYTEFKETAPRR
jgi:predicted transcriptional regulator